ncbi:MAG: hypothetical protein HY507_00800 [Candidatus Zambryskibacteria bacterium]|nr:hypothetical protein [Candidatus Zambryskibacteria bacterium]
MLSGTRKKIFIGLPIVIILSFLIYSFFFDSKLSVSPLAENSPMVGQDILTLVEKLKTISIDPSILSSSLFISLKDFGILLTSEPQGRSNPFAPIGAEFSAPKTPKI